MMLTKVLILLATLLNINAFEIATNYLTACSGQPINAEETRCPQSSIIILKSLSVYASTDSTAIDGASRQCLRVSQCKRIIHNADDGGLSPSYRHLYSWFKHKCQGKQVCEPGSLPSWWQLTGQIKENADETRTCPELGTKYFTGILLHIECVVGQEILTVAPPPDTTAREKPTTPTTTTSFPVFIPVYLPGLEDREKVILAVAIGLAAVILIVLLLILYCCERYRNHKNFLKLLRMLGAPKEQENYDDDYDDYQKTETWTDGAINPDALGEYTGVKPDEFLTMTKQTMENTGQIMYDSAFGTMNTTRRNSCATLTRNNAFFSHPSVESAISGNNYTGPIAYDTEENLDLERRMAAVLDMHDETQEEKTTEGSFSADSALSATEGSATADSILSGAEEDKATTGSIHSADEDHLTSTSTLDIDMSAFGVGGYDNPVAYDTEENTNAESKQKADEGESGYV